MKFNLSRTVARNVRSVACPHREWIALAANKLLSRLERNGTHIRQKQLFVIARAGSSLGFRLAGRNTLPQRQNLAPRVRFGSIAAAASIGQCGGTRPEHYPVGCILLDPIANMMKLEGATQR